jgi:hypothetical protein
MRRIFRQCGSTDLQIKSFAIRYHFLFADALLQARQNFCQRKEVKAINRELSDIIAMVKAGQFDLILQAAQEIEDASFRSLACSGHCRSDGEGSNLTAPSKSPRRLKTHRIVLWRFGKSP